MKMLDTLFGEWGSGLLAQAGVPAWMSLRTFSFASEVDGMLVFIQWISVFFFVFLAGSLLTFALRRRRESSDAQSDSGAAYGRTLGLHCLWTVLAAEVLLFGGLFIVYAFYRAQHPEIFSNVHQHLDRALGGVGTLLMIASSLTMAWALRVARLGKRDMTVGLLFLTLLCGFGFIGSKFVEYKTGWEQSLLWSRNSSDQLRAVETESIPDFPKVSHNGSEASLIARAAAPPAGLASEIDAMEDSSAEALEPETVLPAPGDSPRNVTIVLGIILAMTGLHGFHVLVGMILINLLLMRGDRVDFGPDIATPMDMVGRYWHLVAVTWFILYPMFYLVS